jgi:hypothetical protein
MTESTTRDALAYLLDEMDATARAAYERELAHSPVARAELKACRDALAAFACAVAHPEPLTLPDQRSVQLGLLRASGLPSPSGPRGRGPFAWARLLWPLAAALLLALNLFDFERPLPSLGEARHTRSDTPASRPETAARVSPGAPDAAPPADASRAEAVGANPPDADPRAPGNDARTRELEQLRDAVADLRRVHQQLRERYDSLIERTTGLGVVERELNRFSTMELVDSTSHARGERRGLVSIGRNILTEPGVVIAPDSTPPPAGSTTQTARPPYAWSVFDEKDQRGYLNVYNLPPVGPEQALHLWVRATDTPAYQRVTEIPPQLPAGNGSVQYALPGATTAPVEILITIEPRAITPAIPSGPVVLRGP